MKTATAISSMLIVLAVSLGFCSMAAACPMCRDSVVTNAAGGSGGGGTPVGLFNASIIGVLAGFLVVLGVLLVKIAGAIRAVDFYRAGQGCAPHVPAGRR